MVNGFIFTVSFAEKFQLVKYEMNLAKAKEEIKIIKKEMIKYIEFLVDKRSNLKHQSEHSKGDRFRKGNQS